MVHASAFYFVFIAVLITSPAFGEPSTQDILVSAPRILDESIEASRSVNVIDEREIRLKKPQTVADLLADLPGVDVVRQGAAGQTVSVFIRGARSEDTLVLIDGVEANDAMSPSFGFDFSSLTPEDVARIDVYRGPQSVRFGGGALGGVINIVTREGKGPPAARYNLEHGTYDSTKGAIGVSGKTSSLGYAFSADALRSAGFSAAAYQDGNSEADGAAMGSSSGKLTWAPDAISKIEATIRYAQARVDLDRHGGAGGDDPNDTAQSTQAISSILAQRRFFAEQLSSTLGFYYSEVTRSDSNSPDLTNSDFSSDYFLSENQKVESNHELSFGENHTLRLGLQWRRETGTNSSAFDGPTSVFARQEQSTEGESLTYIYESTSWFGDVGAREDEQSGIGLIPSYRASLGRSLPETRTRLSLTYGTGFKVPSLYQLYSSYGNQNLHWESSDTYDATVEQKFTDDLSISVAYFQNAYRNMIDFDPSTSKYLNISAARSRGVELQSKLQLATFCSLLGNYTYLDTQDESTGLALLRRPTHAANLAARIEQKAYEGFFQAHYESQRQDIDPVSFAQIQDGDYAIFSAGVAYRFSARLKVHARVENLLNRSYEQVAGYGTAGRSFYLGLSGDI